MTPDELKAAKADSHERLKRILTEKTGREPSDEEVREAAHNLLGFFKLMIKWETERQGETEDM